MSPVLIVLLIIAAIWFGLWVAERMGYHVQRVLLARYRRWLDSRRVQLRAEAVRAGRAPGTPPLPAARLKAGAIDAAIATGLGVFFGILLGSRTVTEYTYGADGAVNLDSHLQVGFSFWYFLLFTLVLFFAIGWWAGGSPNGQTIGQELFDYAPRDASGDPLTRVDFLKRQGARIAAAPMAVMAHLQGGAANFEHDTWTATTVATLGDGTSAVPASPRVAPAQVAQPVANATANEAAQPAAPTMPVSAPQPVAIAATSHAPEPVEATSSAPARPTQSTISCALCDESFPSQREAREHALRAHSSGGSTSMSPPETPLASAPPPGPTAPAPTPVPASVTQQSTSSPPNEVLALMPYTVCTVREVPDVPQHPDEGLIFPVPGRDPDSVVLEERDGHAKRFHASTVEVYFNDEKKPALAARDIRATVSLTDARLTIACSKYDKGGGWIGGPTALALNAGSKLLASHRRRGKMLVGQVRYPWIRAVYAQNRAGMLGSEVLRVLIQGPNKTPMRLDLTLPKDVDATAVGTELIRRAAAFRLAHEELDADERVEIEQLRDIAPLHWVKGSGQMAGATFPTYWNAGEHSARFGSASDVAT